MAISVRSKSRPADEMPWKMMEEVTVPETRGSTMMESNLNMWKIAYLHLSGLGLLAECFLTNNISRA